MSVDFVDPETLNKPYGYRHAAVATGTRTVYIAGQVSVDADGKCVGPGDYTVQGRQALSNVIEALTAAGGTPENLVRLNMYAVGLDEQSQAALYKGFGQATREKGIRPVPSTLVGVAALGSPEFLLEVDAIAVLD